MGQEFSYEASGNVTSADGLFFYHTLDLPGHGTTNGHWDLREDAHAYLGSVDLKDKRCLDMGAGSGFLSFQMERPGAREVVSFEIASGADWDIVPHYKIAHELTRIRTAALRKKRSKK